MSIYKSFKRNADGISVHVSQPFPRRVTIKLDDRNKEMQLTFTEAQGLLYALSNVLIEAEFDDKQ